MLGSALVGFLVPFFQPCVTAVVGHLSFSTNIHELTHLWRLILFKAVALGGYTCFSDDVIP